MTAWCAMPSTRRMRRLQSLELASADKDATLLMYFHRLSAEGKEYVLRAAQTAVASGLYR